MPAPVRHEAFVSYSHHDDAWRRRLFDGCVGTTCGECAIWSDAWLRAGDRWQEEIDRRLERCTLAILLTSPRFLASRFIRERELPRILERARAGALRVLWVPIGLGPEQLGAEQPELAALQGALGAAGDALPDDPGHCEPERVLRARRDLGGQIQRAVDPVGAELAALLAPRYAGLERLAEGNRASVYRARDAMLERDVAVKVLKDAEPTRRAAFMADVRRSIRLSEEPNFINLYDCAPAGTLAFCVQQLVAGRTLRERLDALPPGRALPLALLRRIFTRLMRAIARAHAIGVTYGNLKPGNIILDAEDEPFILPVGRRRDEPPDDRRVGAMLARLAERSAHGEAPRAADADDLAYLVPDQFGDGVRPIDPAAVDQYMLGLLGWQMATGRRPAAVAEPQRLPELGRGAFAELPPIGALRPLAPRRVEALIARMTARRPGDRYPDLHAALRELEAMPDLGLLIALDSWRRVCARSAADGAFFRRFYDAFLRRAPAARPLFAHLREADWARQHRLLDEAVLLLLAFHEQRDGDAEPNVLSRIAASHRTVPAALYAPFVDAFVDTVCGDPAAGVEPADPLAAQPRERDVLDEHWRAALAPGVAWLAARSGR